MGRIFCTVNMLIMCDFKKQFIRETVSQLNLKPAVLLYEDLVRILILESFNNWDSLIDFSWRLWSRKIEVSCFGDSNAGTFRVSQVCFMQCWYFCIIFWVFELESRQLHLKPSFLKRFDTETSSLARIQL